MVGIACSSSGSTTLPSSNGTDHLAVPRATEDTGESPMRLGTRSSESEPRGHVLLGRSIANIISFQGRCLAQLTVCRSRKCERWIVADSRFMDKAVLVTGGSSGIGE